MSGGFVRRCLRKFSVHANKVEAAMARIDRVLMAALLGILAAAEARSQPVGIEQAFPSLTFQTVTDLQHAGDGSNRLFVVELQGVIRAFENRMDVASSSVFLDIRSRVLLSNRFGMLALAFHPDFAGNGFFFVHYTAPNPNRSVISRFRVSDADSNSADPTSEKVLLEIGQPDHLHNGGTILFASDGYLYVSMGDGGPGRDPNGYGQDRTQLLGKILRIDIDNEDPGLPYAIPADNPFVGNQDGIREEIWAWGLRNTWKMSYDPELDMLLGAENGEDRWEEINRLESGRNYGWSIAEGNHCFNPPFNCDMTGMTAPLFEYGGTTQRRSVIGGVVYRGEARPELVGQYIYGDWQRADISALTFQGNDPPATAVLATNQSFITTFGTDEQNELYFIKGDGRVYRLAPVVTDTEPHPLPLDPTISLDVFPSPFAEQVNLRLRLPMSGEASVAVFDLLGRRIAQVADRATVSNGHALIWHGVDDRLRSVPPGLYFVRLEVAGRVVTRSVVKAES